MGNKVKLAKLRSDKFYKLAKETGYRSRASFKLIQLNRKYGMLNHARVLVDLCAAPGSWLQVAANSMPINSVIVGVDLLPIKPIRNVITHVSDITSDSCLSLIRKDLQDWKADVVLHDGAPNLGQNWAVDSFGQAQLTLSAVKLMVQVLSPGGWFVTKVFRSKDYLRVVTLLSKLFSEVHSTKPIASRKESAELYVVCRNFVGLKKFDPHILAFKNVFVDEGFQVPKLTLKKLVSNSKPNRHGYDAAVSPYVYAARTLSEFLSAEDPLEFLSKTSEIAIDKEHFATEGITPAEIKHCLKDVRVLGLREVKNLLQYRSKLRKKFNIDASASVVNVPVMNENPSPEDAALQEIEQAERRQKRDQKIRTKQTTKMRKRLERVLKNSESQSQYEPDEELFSLSSLRKVFPLRTAGDATVAAAAASGFENCSASLASLSGGNHEEMAEGLQQHVQGVALDEEADMNFILGIGAKRRRAVPVVNDGQSELKNSHDETAKLSCEDLALGSFMKASSKNKKKLLEDNWNRNVRDMTEELPSWFKEYEDSHRIVHLPITKEQVQFYRQKEKELKSQPPKKVLEAMARKRSRKIAILERTQAKAGRILDENSELDKDKVDEVKRLYKNANRLIKKRQKKTFVVAKKHLATGKKYKKPAGIKGPVKVVDPRMKKDKRNQELRKKRPKKSKARMRSRR